MSGEASGLTLSIKKTNLSLAKDLAHKEQIPTESRWEPP